MPPVNDNIASATVISSFTGTHSGTLLTATREASEPQPSTHSSTVTPTVWYRLDASTRTVIQVQIKGIDPTDPANPLAAVYPAMAIYIGGPTFSQMRELMAVGNFGNSGWDVDPGTPTPVLMQCLLPEAGSYYLQIAAHSTGAGAFEFYLSESAAQAAPSNDKLANAQTIVDGDVLTGDNTWASIEANEKRPTGITIIDHSLWYTFTIAGNHRVRFDGYTDRAFLRLVIYNSSMTQLSAAVVSRNDNQVRSVTLDLSADTYYVHILSSSHGGLTTTHRLFPETVTNAYGEFTVCVYIKSNPQSAPANDDWANAELITPSTFYVDTTWATISGIEPVSAVGVIQNSVWYKIVLATRSTLKVRVVSFTYDVVLTVWSGASEATLTEHVTDAWEFARVITVLDPGTYYIQVGSFDALQGGRSQIEVSTWDAETAAPDLFVNAATLTLPHHETYSFGGTEALEVGEPDPFPSEMNYSCWFKYVATQDGVLRLHLEPTVIDAWVFPGDEASIAAYIVKTTDSLSGLWFIDGYNGVGPSNTPDDNWYESSYQRTAFTYGASISIRVKNGETYYIQCGSYYNGQPPTGYFVLNAELVDDTPNGRWEEEYPVQHGNTGAFIQDSIMFSVGDTIYSWGGRDRTNLSVWLNTGRKFNRTTAKWETVANTMAYYHTPTNGPYVWQDPATNRVYITGGFTNPNQLTPADLSQKGEWFDPNTETWTAFQNTDEVVWYGIVMRAGSRLYLGGCTYANPPLDSQYCRHMWYTDITTPGAWTKVTAQVPQSGGSWTNTRHYRFIYDDNGKLYLVGGADRFQVGASVFTQELGFNYQYDDVGDAWVSKTGLSAEYALNNADDRMRHSVTLIRDENGTGFYVLGGVFNLIGGNMSALVDRYNPDDNTMLERYRMPRVSSCSGLVWRNGKLWRIGGIGFSTPDGTLGPRLFTMYDPYDNSAGWEDYPSTIRSYAFPQPFLDSDDRLWQIGQGGFRPNAHGIHNVSQPLVDTIERFYWGTELARIFDPWCAPPVATQFINWIQDRR